MEHLLPIPGRAANVEMARRLHEHFVQNDFGFWVVELPGICPFIGFVGLQHVKFTAPFVPAVEVGWRLDSDYWGCGYATEAARLALDDAFERLDFQEVVAFTVPFNHRSRRVMGRLGMTRSESDDFDHPRVPDGHPLKRHVLYRLKRSDWLKQGPS